MTPLVGTISTAAQAAFILPTMMTLVRVIVACLIVALVVRRLPTRPRRLAGGALMLVAVTLFRLAARTLSEDNPLRTWALSSSSRFPLSWRDLPTFAALPAPTLAD